MLLSSKTSNVVQLSYDSVPWFGMPAVPIGWSSILASKGMVFYNIASEIAYLLVTSSSWGDLSFVTIGMKYYRNFEFKNLGLT